jgi:hypothetical protein
VLEALLRLGCILRDQSRDNILMVKGAVKVNVPRMFAIPTVVLRHLCQKLSISEADFVRAIPRPSRAMLQGGLDGEDTPPPKVS